MAAFEHIRMQIRADTLKDRFPGLLPRVVEQHRGSDAGFTLVELMITIFIVVTLAALLLVTANRVAETGKKMACSSQLREIGTAMMMFAADNNNRYSPQVYEAPDTLWFSMYSPYLHAKNLTRNKSGGQSVWLCPSDNRFDFVGKGTPAVSYGMNNSASGYTSAKPPAGQVNNLIPLTTLRGPPSQIIFLADSGQNLNFSQPAINWSDSGPLRGNCVEYRHMGTKRDQTKTYAAGEAARQRGYANFLFFDGHVEAFRDDEIRKEMFSGSANP